MRVNPVSHGFTQVKKWDGGDDGWKKVIILSGANAGQEGYVDYEDRDSVAIRAPELIGAEGWYGYYYERKDNVRTTD